MKGIKEPQFSKTLTMSGYKFDFSKISPEDILKHFYIRFHNDLDGYASGAQVFLYYCDKYMSISDQTNGMTETFKTLLEENKVMESINYDYDIDFSTIKKDTIVWIVDYSFSNSDHLRQLENLAKRCEEDNIAIYWIDHHKTSLDLLNLIFIEQHPAFKNINIFLTNKSAACVAVYDYFHDASIADQEIQYIINDNEDSNFYEMDLSSLYYVHLWDTHSDTSEMVLRFKYGMELSNVDPCTVEGLWTWKELFSLTGDVYVEDMIEKGTPSRNAIHDYHNYQLRDMYTLQFEDHLTFVMNTTEHNSLVFEEEYKDPNVLYCVWHFNGRKFIYSFYSTMDSEIDCEAIVKKYGGGGHQHAAGFQSNTFVF